MVLVSCFCNVEAYFFYLFARTSFSPLGIRVGGVPQQEARLQGDQRWEPYIGWNRKNAFCHDDCRNSQG